LLPFLHEIAISFSSSHAVLSGKVLLWPREFTLNAYQVVVGDRTMVGSLLYTIVLTVVYTVLSMAITICAAYPLSKTRLKGRKFFLLIILFTMYFSGGTIPNYLLVKELGLLNTMWALILPPLLSTYNMIILKTFFSTISQSLEESARLDGCSDFGILLRITLPLSKSVLATLSLFYAVAKWNSFQDALFYVTNPKLYPLQLKLYQIVFNAMSVEIRTQEGADLFNNITPESLKAACVMFATMPIILVYPWLQKYFIKGVMIGAVKG